MDSSPFAPTFGSWPPVLAGRSDLEDELRIALSSGTRHEWYTTLLVGSRGTGKTVALSLAMDLAAELGFHTIYELAHPQLIERLTAHLLQIEGKPARRRKKVSATVGFPGMASVTAESESGAEPDRSLQFRSVLESTVKRTVDAGSTGVLIAVDEIHDIELADLAILGGALQIVSRMGGHPAAFVGAGLPKIDQRVLDSTGTTFLERCARYDTGLLRRNQTRQAMEEPFVAANLEYSQAGMNRGIEASAGHPFAIQSIGHHVWALHSDASKKIAASTFDKAIETAIASMGRQVAQPVWKRLSDLDQRFLCAMAAYPDDGVPVAHIAEFVQRNAKWVSRYRDRLIKASVIQQAGRGLVSFSHPAFKSWIRDNVEAQAFGSVQSYS